MNSNDQTEEESKVFPRWLAQTLSQNLNIKYQYFLRERRKADVWISWGKAAEHSCKSLLTFITQFKYIKITKDPHWKFRAIDSANLINKVARSLTGQARVEFISESLNQFSKKKELYDPISPVQLRMAHLETNRLNCYARDLDFLAKRAKPKTWVSAARRNYLRMLRTDFTNPEREFSSWDLCFKNNRAKLHRFETDLWARCFEKNRNRLELLEVDSFVLRGEL
ncbi:hypothetical protein [Leptospira weilii]|uniref:hypothetical protein n=1 Tax=Leptospira weilii TaxID=28184 RepID=UPI0003101067|nr:hypothetical protein [Leptospira weilii]OMI16875.1 hypothetical protein BUQ74_13140 [Leptospira weilii serovar Heyan]ULH27457.1 hypothetical protein FH586_13645 [Leptospira weilii]UPY77554.1 hypothetical protein FH581_001455 [Leptospira weilii]